ncbi:hypothetical protein ATANTOWER_006913 [Ataeniobius toweri]|uniref:U6 snRNA-associated Sm-like protein LSm4 n=1 Tax=Ataeniobius toweri TaxID=208326 RepID=A0ABU7B5A9_9TELE|nr:hypothetical protein [Ataeniobius toweri]
MLPLSLLKTAQNHPMLVELKNGETYNGHLVSCDNWMNINLREVICTSRLPCTLIISQSVRDHEEGLLCFPKFHCTRSELSYTHCCAVRDCLLLSIHL